MFRAFAFAASACSLAFGIAPAAADSVADFYKGKTVSLIIGYSAGGGADLWARFIARHLGRHIPGNPSVIVQNMPGGSGLAAVNYVYNTVPQDGTRIILPSVTVSTAAAMGMPNVRWDTLKFNWLGNLVRDAQSCVASGQSGIKSVTDAREREIIFGSDGATNSTGQHPRLLATLFGYKLKIITGYGGTAQVRLAMERGEVEAVCSVWASSVLGPQRADIDSGKLVPIVQMGTKKHPIFGNAPMVYELTQSKQDLQLMQFVFSPGGNLKGPCRGAGHAGGSGRCATGRVLGHGALARAQGRRREAATGGRSHGLEGNRSGDPRGARSSGRRHRPRQGHDEVTSSATLPFIRGVPFNPALCQRGGTEIGRLQNRNARHQAGRLSFRWSKSQTSISNCTNPDRDRRFSSCMAPKASTRANRSSLRSPPSAA